MQVCTLTVHVSPVPEALKRASTVLCWPPCSSPGSSRSGFNPSAAHQLCCAVLGRFLACCYFEAQHSSALSYFPLKLMELQEYFLFLLTQVSMCNWCCRCKQNCRLPSAGGVPERSSSPTCGSTKDHTKLKPNF